jgi:V8-like Glu-specific endopeptidase
MLAITAYGKPMNNDLATPKNDQEWKPLVAPQNYEFGLAAIDPTAASEYSLTTHVEKNYASNDLTQLPAITGLTSTPSYEGILSQEVNPETVFPPDDRVRVTPTTSYPWRTICKLYMTAADGTQWMASGAIIDNFHILTAGHCVYMVNNGGWISQMEVIPAFDNGVMPVYHAYVTYMRTYTGWTQSQMPEHDWAVCTLDRNVGWYTGWMGRITASSSNSIYTGIVNTAGYPGDLSSGLCMYHDADYGNGASEYNHWYFMDTYGGQSGSPVWVYYSSTGERYIATVHAYGGSLPDGNFGTRLNQDKFDRIISWLSSDNPPTDKPDLTDDGQAWSGFSPTTVTRGQTYFSVWNDVRNLGTASSGGFYVYYYASTNTIISASDYLIGTCYVSTVGAFTWKDSQWSGTFPSSVPAGTYWVGWIIDATYAISEFDESNNIAYKTAYQLTVKTSYGITFYTTPSNLGSITFAGTTYTNGQTGNYQTGAYMVTYNTPPGYVFSNWATTGGVSISGSTATVTGIGTVRAVFTAILTPSFNIWTDKTVYNVGNTMKLYVQVKNPTPTPVPVRAIIYLQLPSGAKYTILDMTTTLPANFDSGIVLYKTFTIPSAPVGSYSWVAQLKNPSTSALIAQTIWNWQIQ